MKDPKRRAKLAKKMGDSDFRESLALPVI
jgi:hypothetical protein